MMAIRLIGRVLRSRMTVRAVVAGAAAAGITAAIALISSAGFAQTPGGSGKVKVEWLGHEFYRLTSPNGVVVITSPWLGNPDGPVTVDELKRTDFILVPN